MARIKVSQATVDSIKSMGMDKAIATAKSGGSEEFKEAARRFYPKRAAEFKNNAAAAAPAVKAESSAGGGAGSAPRKVITSDTSPAVSKGTPAGKKMPTSSSPGVQGQGGRQKAAPSYRRKAINAARASGAASANRKRGGYEVQA